MKKTLFQFLFAAIVFAPLSLFAQTNFPLGELEKMCLKNANDFDTYVLGKDYSIQSKLSDAVTKMYWSDKPGAAGKPYSVARFQNPKAIPIVKCTTTDKKYYIELKTALAANGYKFDKEESKTVNGIQSVWYIYTKGVKQVSLTSYNEGEVTWYGVHIHL
jgi:hypothetical protein